MRILCYGDSNTWGYISGSDHKRHEKRWTKLLQQKLGQNYEIIEEGLNSRTLMSEDPRPGREGRNGFAFLKPCMDTHDKFDIIIVMLGTNELKNSYNNSPQDIVLMLDKYVEFIKCYKSVIDNSSPKLIISGLPIVKESTAYCEKENKYKGASEKSIKLNDLMEKYCQKNNLVYVNNNDLEVGTDGVHLTQESHMILANKFAQLLND